MQASLQIDARTAGLFGHALHTTPGGMAELRSRRLLLAAWHQLNLSVRRGLWFRFRLGSGIFEHFRDLLLR
jgi:hypothetical protein